MGTTALHRHDCRTTVDSAPALSLGVVPNSLKDGLHIRLSHHATLLSEALPQHKNTKKGDSLFSPQTPLTAYERGWTMHAEPVYAQTTQRQLASFKDVWGTPRYLQMVSQLLGHGVVAMQSLNLTHKQSSTRTGTGHATLSPSSGDASQACTHCPRRQHMNMHKVCTHAGLVLHPT